MRKLYLVRYYLVTAVAFAVAKPLFAWYNRAHHSFTPSDVAQAVLHGCSLDASTALYFLVVPLLAVVVSLWWKRWIPVRNVLRCYTAIAAAAMALALVADACLYAFWGFKLNAAVLPYLEQPEGITASVSAGWLAARAVVWALAAVSLYLLLQPPARVKPVGKSTAVSGTVGTLLLVPLMIVGMRGGAGVATTNVGQVYFSENQFLNHTAVNPVFSFLSSFEHMEGDYDIYDFYDDATCSELLRDVYNTRSDGADTLLLTRRPNILVVLMEGAGAMFTSLEGRGDVMPRLSKLMTEGVSFTQCYGNSWRTDRGTVCALSGYPSFPNASVMKMPEKYKSMPSIAKSLRQQGYHTLYLYGGDIDFTNMRGYLKATGWEQLISEDDFSKEEHNHSKWGVPDHITAQAVARKAATLSEPWLIGYSTLSSHEPWDVPCERQYKDDVLNAFRYLDNSIGALIDSLRSSPRWANTLVVILPDHGIDHGGIDETSPVRNHIPLVWAGGAVAAPRSIDAICNQSDLAATLLGQLGVAHDDFTFSRDVLSTTYRRPFAVHNYNNAQAMKDSTGFVLYDFDAHRFVVEQSPQSRRMLELSKAVLQATAADLKRR